MIDRLEVIHIPRQHTVLAPPTRKQRTSKFILPVILKIHGKIILRIRDIYDLETTTIGADGADCVARGRRYCDEFVMM